MPSSRRFASVFNALRARARHGMAVLPFRIKAIDERLPGGGWALGALYEAVGGGNGATDGAAAALFAARIAARTSRGRRSACYAFGRKHGDAAPSADDSQSVEGRGAQQKNLGPDQQMWVSRSGASPPDRLR